MVSIPSTLPVYYVNVLMPLGAAFTQGGVDEAWWPAALIPTEHVDESMPVPGRGERVVRYFADGSYGVVDPRLTVPFDESKIPFTAYAQGLPWPAPLPLRCVRVPSTGRWRLDRAPDTSSSDSLPCAPETTGDAGLSSQDVPHMTQPMDTDVELAADARSEDSAPNHTSTDDTTDARTSQPLSTAHSTTGLPTQSPPPAEAMELCDSTLQPDPLFAQPTPEPTESFSMASGACLVHHTSERLSLAPPTTAPPLHSAAASSQPQPYVSAPQTAQPLKPAGGKNLLNYNKKHENKPAACARPRPDKAKTFLRSKGVKRAQAYLQSGTLPSGFAWRLLGT